MKRFLFLLFASLLPFVTWAYDFSDDSSGTTIYYNYVDGGVEVIWGGSGQNTGTESYTGEVTVPSSVNDGSSDYTVVSVGSRAFYGCSGLTSIILPETLTKIDTYAFYNCSSLTSVSFSGAKITSIGNYAFCMSGITSIDIPETVTSIGTYCFQQSSLESITLPSGITSIPQQAFYGCKSLKYVELSDAVTEIGSKSFQDCNVLEEIVMSKALTTIDANAFNGCSALEKVDLYECKKRCMVATQNGHARSPFWSPRLIVN